MSQKKPIVEVAKEQTGLVMIIRPKQPNFDFELVFPVKPENIRRTHHQNEGTPKEKKQ
jgi:hypothetical protein